VSCRFYTSAAIPTGMVVGHTKMMTPKTSTPKVTRTAVVNEAMAIAAEILARKPDLEILNKVAAVDRGIELVAFYPCIFDSRQYLTSALEISHHYWNRGTALWPRRCAAFGFQRTHWKLGLEWSLSAMDEAAGTATPSTSTNTVMTWIATCRGPSFLTTQIPPTTICCRHGAFA
jgi:hypothetical protein